MLDAESQKRPGHRGTPESYVDRIKAQHRNNAKYKDVSNTAPNGDNGRLFAIRHFAGDVTYDATNFLSANRDTVPDDIVAVFHKSSCTFGFATHLFGMQLKMLYSQESRDGSPRGLSFRISPTAHLDPTSGATEPSSTLTQDFHTRLDNLLRTLVHARPHFIRCIKANNTDTPKHFDRKFVINQIRSLQVLETVNLMASGFSHRLRFRAFNSRYRCLAPQKLLTRCEEKVLEDCKTILEHFMETVRRQQPEVNSEASIAYSYGKRHIFLSEYARQQMDQLRNQRRHQSATLIQATWRGGHFRVTQWPAMRRGLIAQRQAARSAAAAALLSSIQNSIMSGPASVLGGRPRPQPITGTPPPEVCDAKVIQEACKLFGREIGQPPPVPPSRSYTVAGTGKSLHKLSYPQTRICSVSWPEEVGGTEPQLMKGEPVLVVGASNKRGHLLVQVPGTTSQLHVPYQYLELPAFSSKCSSNGTTVPGVNI